MFQEFLLIIPSDSSYQYQEELNCETRLREKVTSSQKVTMSKSVVVSFFALLCQVNIMFIKFSFSLFV